MRSALKEIQSGAFHKEWQKEAKDGFPTLSKLRKEEKKLPLAFQEELIVWPWLC